MPTKKTAPKKAANKKGASRKAPPKKVAPKTAPAQTKAPAPKKAPEPGEADLPLDADNLTIAKALEKSGRLEEAATYYETEIKNHPHEAFSYTRLMIIYRKLKDTKNETRIIDSGINAFTEFYTPAAAKNSNVVKLSNKLNFLVGLTDKKGKALHDPEPIATWKKRKQTLLGRKTKKAKKKS